LATNETVNIQVLIEATKSAKTLGQLEKSIDDVNDALINIEDQCSDAFKSLSKASTIANDKIIDLALSTDTANATIGDLEKSVEVLSDKLKGVDRGTEEFDRLSSKLIETNRELKNVELSLEALDSEQVASELGSVAGAVGDVTTSFILLSGEGNETLEEIANRVETAIGVAVGFKGAIEGIQSGLKLYRNFSDRVKESAVFLKLQTVAQNGLNTATALFSKAVGGGTKAVKGFRTALISTGIGAIVVAVGLLVANFDKLKNLMGGVTDEQKAFNDVKNKAVELAGDELSAIDQLTDTINQEGISRKDRNEAISELQKKYPDLLANIDLEKTGTEQLNSEIKKYTALVQLRAEAEATAELRAESFKEIIQNNTDAQTQQNKTFSTWATSLVTNVEQQKIANAQTKVNNSEIQKQIDILDDLDKANQTKIKNLELELGLDKSSIDAKKDKEKADKEAKTKADALAKKIQQQAQERARAEKQRIKDLAILREEIFQQTITSAEDLEARRLTLEFEAQRKRIEQVVKNDDERKLLLLQSEETFFKQLEEIEKKYKDLDDAKQKELQNKAVTNATDLLIIEEKLQLASLDNTKDNAVERAKIEKNLLDLRIKQINENASISLQAEDLTKDERIKIEKEAQLEIAQIKQDARAKDLQASKEALSKQAEQLKEQQEQLKDALIGLALDTAQQISNTFFEISQEQGEREKESRISKLNETFEEEVEILNERVANGIITQRQADREQLRLEKDQAKAQEKIERDAFNEAKKRQKAQAIINGALAFTNALATTQPLVPLGLLAGAGVLVSTGLQISKIDSQSYAKGGILNGPSHANGGIKTGYGELEGGEAVINKRSTKLFKTELSRINQAGGGRRFATGGILGEPTTASNETTGAGISGVLGQLNDVLSKPIRSYVVEQDITESQARVSSLESNAEL